jgi:hypothetical protein
MLVIRKEQMEVFRGEALRKFEDDMVAHLANFSPPLFKAVQEEQMRKVIRLGVRHAGDHGFTFRGPVRLYLELMLLFGSSFDTDPQFPWAGEILRNRDSEPQMQRADHLYERTRDYRQRVNGPEDAHTLEALKGMAAFAREPTLGSGNQFEPSLFRQMGLLYPQKAEFVGARGLRLLMAEGAASARTHGFTSDRSQALTVVLMFAFGHGCCNDPLYPWIARTLADEKIADPEARAKRLETKALTWLDHVLAYFEGKERA